MEVNPVSGMMIFDVNSGEIWQIFARQGMRNLRNPQLECGGVRIEDIELDIKCRDDVPALLIGLQYWCSQEALRDRLFAIMNGNYPATIFSESGSDMIFFLLSFVSRLCQRAKYGGCQIYQRSSCHSLKG